MHKIFVFGSLNYDLVITSPKEVKQGETIMGSGFMSNCGGKGANQAVAVGKLGGEVYMGGAIGNDSFGKSQIESLTKYNVNTDCLGVKENAPTGVAVIVIVNNDNRIILDSGANALADEKDVDRLLENACKGDILLTQLENKIDIVGYALKKAKEKEMVTILNPAPINKDIIKYIGYCDYFIPNENEFEEVSNTHNIVDGYSKLIELGVKNVIVTLGSEGYCYCSNKQLINEPCIKMNVVDTTAAGDTFCGAFAVGLSKDKSVIESLRFANKAAALTVTKKGAQQSIPTLKELDEYYK